jgi:hypothetical protein
MLCHEGPSLTAPLSYRLQDICQHNTAEPQRGYGPYRNFFPLTCPTLHPAHLLSVLAAHAKLAWLLALARA